jgi:polyisoprenoid-binding protein YceI
MNLLVVVLAATLFRVEPVNGTVSFSILKWGVIREEGHFREFKANIHYDAADVARSRVNFEVRTASVDTKNPDRDGTLRSDNFFDVKRYPTMTFRSTKVVPRGKDLAHVTGDLTIRGVTRSVTVPVRLVGISTQDGVERAGFETTFTVDRRQFGITGGRWIAGAPSGILGNDVTVRVIAGGVAARK